MDILMDKCIVTVMVSGVEVCENPRLLVGSRPAYSFLLVDVEMGE
jgi:hypothetical protein